MLERRELGTSGIRVSAVGLGGWPISGMTSRGVTESDSLATLAACRDCGVNFFDTAYCYGADGESERLIGRVVRPYREEVVIATKCGIEWGPAGERVIDGRPATLRRQCDASLGRIGVDCVDLLYLHAPDARTPLADSAGALRELRDAGKTRAVGVSNVSLEQLQAFHAVCPVDAVQPAYNMLQRQIESDLLPWCREQRIAVVVYWPLLKGLLAGKLPRDFVFPPEDGRPKYPMFQGQEWQRNQDFVDRLREIAADEGRTVADLAIQWTIHQPGITAALCGAKRPEQIRETAAALTWRMSAATRSRIDQALALRGTPVVRAAV